MTPTPQFAINHNKGFQMTFGNGMTISVQFGTDSYCSRRNFHIQPMSEMKEYIVISPDAEIAIWDTEGNWFQFANDQVEGFVTPDEVGMWIEAIMMSESLNDLQTIAEESGLVEKILNQK